MYGLIFDVDGVIADTERVNAEASIQAFAELVDAHGIQRADFADGLGRGAEAYMRAAADVHNLRIDDEQLVALCAARQDNFLTRLHNDPLPPYPGVMDLMTAGIAAANVRVAIATSSTREKSQAVLTSAGIPYQDLVYLTGSDVRRKKPDPELFATAAARLEIAPENCVVIEDAPNGVAAAQAAGCHCIAVTNSVDATALAAADRVVDSLDELSLGDIITLAQASEAM